MLSHAGVKVLLLEDAAQAAKIAKVRDKPARARARRRADGRGRGRDHARRPALARRRRRRRRSRASAPRRSRPRTRRRSSTRPAPPARPRAACSRTRTCSTRPTPTSTGSSCAASPPVIFQYLPLAHVLARMVAFVALDTGGVLAFWSRRHEEARRGDQGVQPDAHPDRPAPAGEDPHARGRPGGGRAGGAKAAIFKRALATGEKVAKAKREGRKVSPIDQARHAVGDKLALSKVRDALGTGNPVLITGAAPIGTEVIEFFYACGVPVLEGYGMTETCAAATLNIVAEVRVGSVGRPLPGHRGLDRRRRRGPDARPARLQGLPPQRPRTPRRSSRAAGCTPATSARSTTATCTSPAARRT